MTNARPFSDLKDIEESAKKEVREAAKKAKSLSMSETKKNIENLTDQITLVIHSLISLYLMR